MRAALGPPGPLRAARPGVSAAGAAAGALLALGAGCALAALLVRGRWRAVTVVGGSMLPALRDGDVLLLRRGSPARARVGDVVVFAPPPVPPPGRGPGPPGTVSRRRDAEPGPPGTGSPPPRPTTAGAAGGGAALDGDAAAGAAGSGTAAGWMVKRVAAVPGDPLPDVVRGDGRVPPRTLVVLGDNGGYDSRVFGALPVERVLGVVVRRIGRAPARGAADREYVLHDDVRRDPLLDHLPRPGPAPAG